MKRLGTEIVRALCTLAVLLGLYEVVHVAKAGVSCSVPFTFVNGTIADASQVNSNFNSLVTCLSNAASAGVNSDITILAGLTTPLAASEGGSQTFSATATSTGTANAQIIANTLPIGFSLVLGRRIVWVSGFSNTGATTLNVAGSGVLNLFRVTAAGPGALVGGEILTGQVVEAVYDGSEYQMVSAPGLGGEPGTVFDWAGSSCPVGSLEANNQTPASSSFPALSAVLGTIWGTPGGGNFQIPDLRGRTTFQRDSGGSGRITVAGGNFDGTTVGTTGGQQNQTLSLAQLPVFSQTPSFTGTQQTWNSNQSVWSSSNTTFTLSGPGGTPINNGQTVTMTITPSGTISAVTFGSGNAHPVLSNGAIVLKCVKA